MVLGTETAGTETVEVGDNPLAGAIAEVETQEAPIEEEAAETKAEQAKEPSSEEAALARAVKAEENLQRLQARYDSVVGSTRSSAEERAKLNRLMAQQQAIIERLDTPDAEPGSLKKRVAELTDEAAKQLADKETRDEWLGELSETLQKAGLTGREPEFGEAGRYWQQGKGDSETPDLRLIHKAITSANAVVFEHLKKKAETDAQAAVAKAETQRKQGNQANRTLGAGASSGRGGGVTVTKDNIDQLYNQGKVSADRYQKFLSTGELS